ncbi:hypothetical protein MAC_00313 [Metarhizium acridum CQMa 102]|uniref:DUF3533 domain-containing protein n=1 Tax=Metarhizium acridum (strain CQMa 102) TaxID=655827 RepID=E9DRE4_METAQ|nr:uncharacterized protein MAC_00313 [Metarhizium acridum CQMa 102]EFY93822.1 hypothetical protein MAC_00313 [Metarhizium acridum CQMa 102]
MGGEKTRPGRTFPLSIVHKYYPRAWDCRLPFLHPVLKATRPKLTKAGIISALLVQVVFFALFCYLFGALYQQGPRTHNLSVLWVDYDGGIIGQAVNAAYARLRSDQFPTLVARSASQYPSADALRGAVCDSDYWAAMYTAAGSSANLGLAIAGLNTSQYNESDVLFYIWNEAKYPAVMDGALSSNMVALSSAARISYVALNGTAALATMPPDNPAALSVFANPWTVTSINLKTTTQGARAVYNTIAIVLILLQNFFFLATINGLYVQFKIYNRAPPRFIILIRAIISCGYTFFGGLLITAAIWAFKAGWNVSGAAFVLDWMTFWLLSHVSFLVLDVFSIWIPPQYVPFALVTWVITNVTSVIVPFSLSSGFYRWGYALPAHAAYEVLTDIWSGGCNPHLYYALPVLFSYEVLGNLGTSLGVYKRRHLAVVAEEATKQAAMLLEQTRERRQSRANGEPLIAGGSGQVAGTRTEDAEESEREQREELEEEDEQAAEDIQRLETQATRIYSNLGPAFQLVGSDER